MLTALIILGVLVVIAFVWISIYNSLIKLRTWAEGSFSQIDVQLQRRNDLIPNIVETVKGYASHERETLEAVTAARQQIMNLPADATPEQINAMSNQLSGALSRLLAVAEAYPDLKASEVYTQTMESVNKFEDNVRHSRMIYNDVVTNLNRMVRMFPSNLIASMFNFTEKEYFKGTTSKQDVPS